MVLVGLYLGFGQPDMARIFVRELGQARLAHRLCLPPRDDTRLVQITAEHMGRLRPLPPPGQWAGMRELGQVVLVAARRTLHKTFARPPRTRTYRPGPTLQRLSRHLPTFFLPDHRNGENFLSLTGAPIEAGSLPPHLALVPPPRAPEPPAMVRVVTTVDLPVVAVAREPVQDAEPASGARTAPAPQSAPALEQVPEQVPEAERQVVAAVHSAKPLVPAHPAPEVLDQRAGEAPDAAGQVVPAQAVRKVAGQSEEEASAPRQEAKSPAAGVGPEKAPLPEAVRLALDAGTALASPYEIVVHGKTAGPVTAIRFAGDARHALAAGADGALRLWDLAAGRLLHVFAGHEGWIWSADVSKDGRLAVSAGRDGFVRLWDLEKRQQRLSFRAHKGQSYAVAMAGDGTHFATAGDSGDIKLWRSADGALVHRLKGHEKLVRALAFSPDGSKLLSGSGDLRLNVWDRASGVLVKSHKGHVHPLLAVGFLGNSERYVSGGGGNVLMVWSADAEKPSAVKYGHRKMVRAIAARRDGSLFASADGDGQIRLWDGPDLKPLATLAGSIGGVLSAAFSQDGKMLLTAGRDGAVRLWQVDDQLLHSTFVAFADGSHVSFRPDGRLAGQRRAIGHLRLRLGEVVSPVSDRYLSQFYMARGFRPLMTAAR